MTPIIIRIHKNGINTLTIDMYLPGLKIIKDFMVCPITRSSKQLRLVHDHDFIEVDREGKGRFLQSEPESEELSIGVFMMEQFQFKPDDWERIKTYIPLTTGVHTIEDGLIIDNSGAKTFFE